MALLLTEQVVELRPYNKKPGAVTWEECSLRGYLNTTFTRYFSNDEISIIVKSLISNEANLWSGVKGGQATDDYFFLLSLDEIDNYFDKSGYYRDKVIKRTNRITNSCDKDRAIIEPWWLRSPGKTSADAAFVTGGGCIYVGGQVVNSYDIGVRPAVWLSLKNP